MHPRPIPTLLAGATALALTLSPLAVGSASAEPRVHHRHHRQHAEHAVFVQTNGLTGNTVVAYRRSDSGALTPSGTYPTGGTGGLETSAPVDALASQGSLTYDAESGLLFAVNAGSDTLSVFGVDGARLHLRQVVPTRGSFPVSVAVHGEHVVVLNAGGDGSVVGFRLRDRHLAPISGPVTSLGLGNATTPLFITAPGQVGFTPDGRHVVVTTKKNGTLVAFRVRRDGRLSAPTITASVGAVPFSFVADRFGHIVVSEAGPAATTTYDVHLDGRLTPITASVASGGKALCWLAAAGRFVYASNTGSSTLSAYATGAQGHLTLVQAVAATTDAAPIDQDATTDGRFVYVQDAGAGEVQGFRVEKDGTLTLVATATGLPAFDGSTGMEGIVAV
jgi:6-phosphogluconolactonase (cycloisomerase 2 family)